MFHSFIHGHVILFINLFIILSFVVFHTAVVILANGSLVEQINSVAVVVHVSTLVLAMFRIHYFQLPIIRVIPDL